MSSTNDNSPAIELEGNTWNDSNRLESKHSQVAGEGMSRATSGAPLHIMDKEGGGEDISESASEHSSDDAHKLNMTQACALNTLNMFGTGPFITIPFLIAATDPPGPQALIGYAMAAIVCINDAYVWGELGSLYPNSGGSYKYLRETYGRHSYGQLMAFLFCWQQIISGPLEIASGFIAMSQYLAYITDCNEWWQHSLIGLAFCVVSMGLLWKDTGEVGHTTVALWVGTVLAIAFTLFAGFIHFDPKNLETPDNAYSDGFKLFWSFGVAMRIGIYDFMGYYDICFVGDEVKNPSVTIPQACVVTCQVVAVVFFAVNFAVIGYLPWHGEDGFVELVEGDTGGANYIMSLFMERMFNRGFAIFFTLVVLYTIFGSCFSLLLGYSAIPWAAARDGMFFQWFGHLHPTKQGLADHSLLATGIMTGLCCFLDLELLINGLVTTRLVCQFIAQAVSVILHRKHFPDAERPYKMPLYPLPVIICIVFFTFVFVTTENYIIMNQVPLLELAIAYLLVGLAVYFPWAKTMGMWPYNGYGYSMTTPAKGWVDKKEDKDTEMNEKGAKHMLADLIPGHSQILYLV
mmetsp:Transcript_1838/g.2880  ORF Transcript_1838/g.2880 Transcript_1838/m.2880 type:complete len:574 (+) Transcript_1838:177-1898(+)